MYDIERYTHHGLTIRIVPDDMTDSSRDWDNLGHMVCWHPHYNLGDEQVAPGDFESLDLLVQSLVEEFDPTVILPLYLYEHSGITIRAGAPIDVVTDYAKRKPFALDSQGWDTSFVGFILDTADTRKLIGDMPRQQRIEALTMEVDTYATYLEGGVVGFIVEDDDGNHLDSCFGFYELDDCKEQAENPAEAEAGTLAERRAADAKVRFLAAWEYADDDLVIDDDAPVESVDGGYWVNARVWIDDAAVKSRQGENA